MSLDATDIPGRIRRMYEQHNAEKLEKLPELLKKYEGREQSLLDSLVQKYGPETSVDDNADATAASIKNPPDELLPLFEAKAEEDIVGRVIGMQDVAKEDDEGSVDVYQRSESSGVVRRPITPPLLDRHAQRPSLLGALADDSDAEETETAKARHHRQALREVYEATGYMPVDFNRARELTKIGAGAKPSTIVVTSSGYLVPPAGMVQHRVAKLRRRHRSDCKHHARQEEEARQTEQAVEAATRKQLLKELEADEATAQSEKSTDNDEEFSLFTPPTLSQSAWRRIRNFFFWLAWWLLSSISLFAIFTWMRILHYFNTLRRGTTWQRIGAVSEYAAPMVACLILLIVYVAIGNDQVPETNFVELNESPLNPSVIATTRRATLPFDLDLELEKILCFYPLHERMRNGLIGQPRDISQSQWKWIQNATQTALDEGLLMAGGEGLVRRLLSKGCSDGVQNSTSNTKITSYSWAVDGFHCLDDSLQVAIRNEAGNYNYTLRYESNILLSGLCFRAAIARRLADFVLSEDFSAPSGSESVPAESSNTPPSVNYPSAWFGKYVAPPIFGDSFDATLLLRILARRLLDVDEEFNFAVQPFLKEPTVAASLLNAGHKVFVAIPTTAGDTAHDYSTPLMDLSAPNALSRLQNDVAQFAANVQNQSTLLSFTPSLSDISSKGCLWGGLISYDPSIKILATRGLAQQSNGIPSGVSPNVPPPVFEQNSTDAVLLGLAQKAVDLAWERSIALQKYGTTGQLPSALSLERRQLTTVTPIADIQTHVSQFFKEALGVLQISLPPTSASSRPILQKLSSAPSLRLDCIIRMSSQVVPESTNAKLGLRPFYLLSWQKRQSLSQQGKRPTQPPSTFEALRYVVSGFVALQAAIPRAYLGFLANATERPFRQAVTDAAVHFGEAQKTFVSAPLPIPKHRSPNFFLLVGAIVPFVLGISLIGLVRRVAQESIDDVTKLRSLWMKRNFACGDLLLVLSHFLPCLLMHQLPMSAICAAALGLSIWATSEFAVTFMHIFLFVVSLYWGVQFIAAISTRLRVIAVWWFPRTFEDPQTQQSASVLDRFSAYRPQLSLVNLCTLLSVLILMIPFLLPLNLSGQSTFVYRQIVNAAADLSFVFSPVSFAVAATYLSQVEVEQMGGIAWSTLFETRNAEMALTSSSGLVMLVQMWNVIFYIVGTLVFRSDSLWSFLFFSPLAGWWRFVCCCCQRFKQPPLKRTTWASSPCTTRCVLSVDNVCVKRSGWFDIFLPSFASTSTVEDLSFHLPSGAVLGLVGAGGSGKSALVDAIFDNTFHFGTCTTTQPNPIDRIQKDAFALACSLSRRAKVISGGSVSFGPLSDEERKHNSDLAIQESHKVIKEISTFALREFLEASEPWSTLGTVGFVPAADYFELFPEWSVEEVLSFAISAKLAAFPPSNAVSRYASNRNLMTEPKYDGEGLRERRFRWLQQYAKDRAVSGVNAFELRRIFGLFPLLDRHRTTALSSLPIGEISVLLGTAVAFAASPNIIILDSSLKRGSLAAESLRTVLKKRSATACFPREARKGNRAKTLTDTDKSDLESSTEGENESSPTVATNPLAGGPALLCTSRDLDVVSGFVDSILVVGANESLDDDANGPQRGDLSRKLPLLSNNTLCPRGVTVIPQIEPDALRNMLSADSFVVEVIFNSAAYRCDEAAFRRVVDNLSTDVPKETRAIVISRSRLHVRYLLPALHLETVCRNRQRTVERRDGAAGSHTEGMEEEEPEVYTRRYLASELHTIIGFLTQHEDHILEVTIRTASVEEDNVALNVHSFLLLKSSSGTSLVGIDNSSATLPPLSLKRREDRTILRDARTKELPASRCSPFIVFARRVIASFMLRCREVTSTPLLSLFVLVVVPLVLFALGGALFRWIVAGADVAPQPVLELSNSAFQPSPIPNLRIPVAHSFLQSTSTSETATARCCLMDGELYHSALETTVASCPSSFVEQIRNLTEATSSFRELGRDVLLSSSRLGALLLSTFPPSVAGATFRFAAFDCSDITLARSVSRSQTFSPPSVLLYNLTATHSSVVGLALATNALLRLHTGNPTIDVRVRTCPVSEADPPLISADALTFFVAALLVLPFLLRFASLYAFVVHLRLNRGYTPATDGILFVLIGRWAVELYNCVILLLALYLFGYLFGMQEFYSKRPGLYAAIIFLYSFTQGLIILVSLQSAPMTWMARLRRIFSAKTIQLLSVTIFATFGLFLLFLGWATTDAPRRATEILRFVLRIWPSFTFGEVFLNSIRSELADRGLLEEGTVNKSQGRWIDKPFAIEFSWLYLGIEAAVLVLAFFVNALIQQRNRTSSGSRENVPHESEQNDGVSKASPKRQSRIVDDSSVACLPFPLGTIDSRIPRCIVSSLDDKHLSALVVKVGTVTCLQGPSLSTHPLLAALLEGSTDPITSLGCCTGPELCDSCTLNMIVSPPASVKASQIDQRASSEMTADAFFLRPLYEPLKVSIGGPRFLSAFEHLTERQFLWHHFFSRCSTTIDYETVLVKLLDVCRLRERFDNGIWREGDRKLRNCSKVTRAKLAIAASLCSFVPSVVLLIEPFEGLVEVSDRLEVAAVLRRIVSSFSTTAVIFAQGFIVPPSSADVVDFLSGIANPDTDYARSIAKSYASQVRQLHHEVIMAADLVVSFEGNDSRGAPLISSSLYAPSAMIQRLMHTGNAIAQVAVSASHQDMEEAAATASFLRSILPLSQVTQLSNTENQIVATSALLLEKAHRQINSACLSLGIEAAPATGNNAKRGSEQRSQELPADWIARIRDLAYRIVFETDPAVTGSMYRMNVTSLRITASRFVSDAAKRSCHPDSWLDLGTAGQHAVSAGAANAFSETDLLRPLLNLPGRGFLTTPAPKDLRRSASPGRKNTQRRVDFVPGTDVAGAAVERHERLKQRMVEMFGRDDAFDFAAEEEEVPDISESEESCIVRVEDQEPKEDESSPQPKRPKQKRHHLSKLVSKKKKRAVRHAAAAHLSGPSVLSAPSGTAPDASLLPPQDLRWQYNPRRAKLLQEARGEEEAQRGSMETPGDQELERRRKARDNLQLELRDLEHLL